MIQNKLIPNTILAYQKSHSYMAMQQASKGHDLLALTEDMSQIYTITLKGEEFAHLHILVLFGSLFCFSMAIRHKGNRLKECQTKPSTPSKK